MESACKYITALVEKGGPDPPEYDQLLGWFSSIGESLRKGEVQRDEIRALFPCFGDAVSIDTMQGFVVRKPHGYAGDFEIIDRIYRRWMSPNKRLRNWDYFFHDQDGPRAVRNRKDYFLQLLHKLEQSSSRPVLNVLNVGSGPGRDIAEYLATSNTRIHFCCIDQEPKAITYAQHLCRAHQDRVTFRTCNIFRFKAEQRYDLIWAGGLFDYLNDKTFTFLLNRLLGMVRDKGRVVVGNFSIQNASRYYMEFGEWFLEHRTEEVLLSLADRALATGVKAYVESEPAGVNLFLHAVTQ